MDRRKIISLAAQIRNSANLMIEEELEKNSIDGIVPAHGSVLNILFSEREGIPMKQLVERTGKAKSTITSNITTLLKYGYIEKGQDPTDARSQLILLTDRGRELEEIFNTISHKILTKTYKDVSVEEQDQVITILEKIVNNLR